jgi:hypothetical protein
MEKYDVERRYGMGTVDVQERKTIEIRSLSSLAFATC